MARLVGAAEPTAAPAEALDAAITRVGAMNVDALRACWRETLGSDPPPAFAKDLLARAISYRLQEQALGGLNATTARLLRSLTNPGAEPPRQVKVGSVIVREHKGVVHEVLVVPGGFRWRGEAYASLSTIARKITGVSWNGPRFFGLRSSAMDERDGPSAGGQSARREERKAPHTPGENASRRFGRRSSVRSASGAGVAR
jgi:Protein of unknown function (DUF2924)